MADIIDQANDTADLYLNAALRKQQHEDIVTPSGIGMCLSCGEPVEGDRRWCDKDCRDDWQVETKRAP